MKYLQILVAAVVAVSPLAASAEPASKKFLDRKIELTMADYLSLVFEIVSLQTRTAPVTNDSSPLDFRIHIADAEGFTRIEFLMAEKWAAQMQSGSPGRQTQALLKMHKSMYDSLFQRDYQQIGGIFDNISTYWSESDKAVVKFMKNVKPSDLIVSVGFRQGDRKHLYATIYDNRVEFAPNAPKATAQEK